MSTTLDPLLSVDNLHTSFFTQDGTVKAVQETSFAVRPGEILGIVGESGCGKTTAGLSVMGLVPYPGRVVDGRITFLGADLNEMDEDDRRILRGEAMAMIFQDPAGRAESPDHRWRPDCGDIQRSRAHRR